MSPAMQPDQHSQAQYHQVKISGYRLRRYANFIFKHHALHQRTFLSSRTNEPPIRIVCVSDTHNNRPSLPTGDILIHAGDLTENGSFDEMQDGLDWLGAQPHRYKILVAGNHDVIMDEDFLSRHSKRRYGSSKTHLDLIWPDGITYLNDSSVALEISREGVESDSADQSTSLTSGHVGAKGTRRTLKIYGSPYTPQYVPSAFQYARVDGETFWTGKIPVDADVVVTHGPPRLHLDTASGIHRGCPFLGEEVARVRPALHVFGHIHAGYGVSGVVFDDVRKQYEMVVNHSSRDDRWWEWPWVGVLFSMVFSTLWCYVKCGVLGVDGIMRHGEKVTTMVNASVVGWDERVKGNVLRNEAIVVEL